MAAKRTPFSASIAVRARRDGTVAFDVRFRVSGTQRKISFDDEQAATKWANMLRQIGPEQALELITLDSGDTPTVDEFAEKYISSKSGVEGGTLDRYRTYMRTSISPAMGSLPIDAVDPTRIAAWVNEQNKTFAAKTIANRHGFLYAMFEYAREATPPLVTRNPCAKTRLPSGERVEMVFLTPGEFATLLAFVPPHYQPLVTVLAATGMRFNEATALKPQDFDIANQTVRVSRAWKYSAAIGWYIGPPKTKKSKRSITLPVSMIPMLSDLVSLPNEYVFVNAEGGPVRQSKFFNETWQPARRLANGKPAFTERNGNKDWKPRKNGVWDRMPATEPIRKLPRVHDLRHSHAFWLIQDGHALAVIQQRLGHESIQTTSDTYGHLSPDMMRAAASTISAALAPAAMLEQN